MNKRPLPVIIISCLFVTAGIFGFVYHAAEFNAEGPFEYELVWVLFIRVLAIVGGVFTFRGDDWARWLLLVWIAYHVILSGFHSIPELVMHGVLFAVVAFFLFHPKTTAYFRGPKAASAQGPKMDHTPMV